MSNVIAFPGAEPEGTVYFDDGEAELSVTVTEDGRISLLVGNGDDQTVAIVAADDAELFARGICEMVALARGGGRPGAA